MMVLILFKLCFLHNLVEVMICGPVALITDAVCLQQSYCQLLELGMLPTRVSGASSAKPFFDILTNTFLLLDYDLKTHGRFYPYCQCKSHYKKVL